jgi:hypothetical protein
MFARETNENGTSENETRKLFDVFPGNWFSVLNKSKHTSYIVWREHKPSVSAQRSSKLP